MQFEDLMSLRQYVAIAHHVPGRLRLKFDPAVRNAPGFDALREAQSPFPGVQATRINTMARSMVIEYDTRISSNDIKTLFTGDEDRARASFEKISDAVSGA